MTPTGLRVAFDMDGTIADMHTMLRREAERLFGPIPPASEADTSSPPADIPAVVARDDLRLDRDQWRTLWERVERIENFWTTLPEMEPGIVARIASAARVRRWDVVFITTRPATAGDTTQMQTQSWLHRQGFEFPSVFVMERSRGRLASVLQLDAFVDDRPENCLSVAMDSKAKALLIWPGGRETMPPGLDRVGVRPFVSIGDAVTWIEKLDDRRRQAGVVRSVRRLFRGSD